MISYRVENICEIKARNYEIFKIDLKTANYLQSFMPKFKISLSAQFRIGVLPLHIETGRYHLTKGPKSKTARKINVEERTYLVCNENSVEHEIHLFIIIIIMFLYSAQYLHIKTLFNQSDCTGTAPTHK